MATNGQLPASSLARIKGNGWLRKDAAASWNAMAAAAARDGVDLSIWESSIRRTYRPLSAQHAAYRLYGPGMAARPGTSNHGWGLAVDLMNMTQRRWIDRNGAKYGWAKRWSDAQHEWWHLKYRPGVWKGSSAGSPTLRLGSRGESVKKCQRLLRSKNVQGAPRVTGFYGVATRKAVWRFQKKHGLKPDGVCGPRTWRLLRR